MCPPSFPAIPWLTTISPSASSNAFPTVPFTSMLPAALMEKPSSTLPLTYTVPRNTIFPVLIDTLPSIVIIGSTLILFFINRTCPFVSATIVRLSSANRVFFPNGIAISLPAAAGRYFPVTVFPLFPSCAGIFCARGWPSTTFWMRLSSLKLICPLLFSLSLSWVLSVSKLKSILASSPFCGAVPSAIR